MYFSIQKYKKMLFIAITRVVYTFFTLTYVPYNIFFSRLLQITAAHKNNQLFFKKKKKIISSLEDVGS